MEENKNMDVETCNGDHKRPMPPAIPMPEMPLMHPPMPMHPCYPMPGYGQYMPMQPPCYHMMPQMPMRGEDMHCQDPMMYGYGHGGMYPPMYGGMHGYGQMPPWGDMYGYGQMPWGMHGMPQPKPEFPRTREAE